jgi:hypothetical protein
MPPQRHFRDVPHGLTCRAGAAALLMILACTQLAPAQSAPATGTQSAAAGSGIRASSRWLPRVDFHAPLSLDGLQPRVAVGIGSSDLLTRRLSGRDQQVGSGERELHFIAALGASVPLLLIAQWQDGGVSVGIDAGVVERFRLRGLAQDALAYDWTVGLPIELVSGAWGARLVLHHRSAHLGDETLVKENMRTLSFERDALDLLVTRAVGAGRIFAGGALVRPGRYTADRWTARAGADVESRGSGAVGLTAAAQLARESLTGSLLRASIAAGPVLHGGRGSAVLLFRLDSGGSSLGEFFPDRERFFSVELIMR